MPKYLTVAQYKAADDGIVPVAAGTPTDLSDQALAGFLARAEGDIDSYMGFSLQLGGFEPHTVSVQQQWDERSLKNLFPLYPVPVRQVVRYRIQVSNISTSGAGFFASIAPGDCVINEFGGYIEIVPLQAVTYSLSPVILQLGLRPPIVQMDVEVGYFLPVFGEALFTSNNKTYFGGRAFWVQVGSYTQALATQPAVLPPIPPVVYVNGVVADSSTYTVNFTEGSVTFPVSQANNTVTADYTYVIPDSVRDATIAQVTYILGQRVLNKLGMQGVESVRSADQTLKRHMLQNSRGDEGTLCPEASSKLAQYQMIPLL